MTNKIKLNTPCPVCLKSIYLGQETAHTKEGVYHLECYIGKKMGELFKFELDNDVLNYNTLIKLKNIKNLIK
jgi:hypothetical protein